jgi:hypothetical protein
MVWNTQHSTVSRRHDSVAETRHSTRNTQAAIADSQSVLWLRTQKRHDHHVRFSLVSRKPTGRCIIVLQKKDRSRNALFERCFVRAKCENEVRNVATVAGGFLEVSLVLREQLFRLVFSWPKSGSAYPLTVERSREDLPGTARNGS